ncbi:terpenoid synthase [Fomitiporia mediterranea MF3/22]|uniref:terpenoid synthase n=1 Tax=Fomitiporia mediterranea (strain MF3/22) TaxID=694068 RepID=UPI00044079CD|nr:terpenoid synthase [Fomitiporia mediterranea MF3/22]EJD02130.1 terpenoid synthase [Fomitiporia mediterranea MF3/22]
MVAIPASPPLLPLPLVAADGPRPSAKSAPKGYFLPDLVGHCEFPLTYNPHGDTVAPEADKWLDQGCPELAPKARKALYGLRAGELTAFCYTSCDAHHLRVISDFMNYLFHLDNISDGMMTREADVLSDIVMNALWFPDEYRLCKGQSPEEISAGKLARDYWRRCIADAGPGVQARFKENLQLFFEAVHIQATHREDGEIPELESYIDVRRDESGCKPVFDLIEYGLGINLPDFVIEHPIIKALNQGSNDLVTWSNDIFSYNVEQARGDTHNMIIILETRYGMELQDAMDYVGEMCRVTMENFVANKARVPSFGCPQLDRDVAGYVQGLQDWIVGALHWSFMSKRYFGTEGAEIKKHRYVKLLPKKTSSTPPACAQTTSESL